MQTILVMNSKGGCGKTTVTTNLASFYASLGYQTAIMDYDPQRSSLHWIKSRGPGCAEIYSADAAPQKGGAIRSLKMHLPRNTQRLIIDAPAGVEGLLLQEMVRKANCIVIPVGPSSIDIHATADFVKDLLLVGRIRSRDTKVAVVANRVRSSMPVYEPLERFLKSLNLPFLTRISDSDQYIMAAEQGLGVYEMESHVTAQEQAEFSPLVEWLATHAGDEAPANRTPMSGPVTVTAAEPKTEKSKAKVVRLQPLNALFR